MVIGRRQFGRAAGVAVAGLLLTGHSPYRQWQVFRKSRLIILASAGDEGAVELASKLATLLATHVPESRAMMSRAPDAVSIAKLIGSKQLDVAVLSTVDARDALAGTGAFVDDGVLALRTLAAVGTYLLVSRDDFPAPIAYQIARAITERWSQPEPKPVALTPDSDGVSASPVPLHPGARDYYQGQPASTSTDR